MLVSEVCEVLPCPTPVTTPDFVTVSLRLPRHLHERLIKLAEAEHRSLSAQLRHLIAKAPV
jgi:hypothetical protein